MPPKPLIPYAASVKRRVPTSATIISVIGLGILAFFLAVGGRVGPERPAPEVELESPSEPSEVVTPATVPDIRTLPEAPDTAGDTHFVKQFSQAVRPEAEHLFLRVDGAPKSLVSVRVTAIAGKFEGDVKPAMREDVWVVSWEEIPSGHAQVETTFEGPIPGLEIVLRPEPERYATLWGVRTPPGYDSVLFRIEVLANQPVAVTELRQ